jgi:uncharacterized protein (TIGR03435 family)
VNPSPPSGRASFPKIGPASFTGRGYTLRNYVTVAYGVEQYQVDVRPGWSDFDRYDIDARSESATSPGQIRLMLRALLADRFQLKTHSETRSIAMNVLVVAKGAPKFGPSFHEMKDGDPPPDLGKFSRTHLAYPGLTIKDFLSRLRQLLPIDMATGAYDATQAALPLLDGTGLTGRYAIALDTGGGDTWSAILEQQLGLKLEERKVPTEVIVIDGAAKPAGN